MEKYKGFIFDWDGTVARSLEVWLELMREAYAVFGVTGLSDTDIAESFGHMEETSYRLGMEKGRFPEFHTYIGGIAKSRIPRAPMYIGVQEILEELKNKNVLLGIVTANQRRVIDEILGYNGLLDIFDVVVSGDEVAAHKPDPEGVLRVIEKFGLSKKDVLSLGDSKHDIGAAKNAGIDSVLFYPASHELFHDFEEIKALRPTYIIDDWLKLTSI